MVSCRSQRGLLGLSMQPLRFRRLSQDREQFHSLRQERLGSRFVLAHGFSCPVQVQGRAKLLLLLRSNIRCRRS